MVEQGKEGNEGKGKTGFLFRLPFVVPLIAVAIITVAATSGVIGGLTFAGWNKSTSEFTTTLRKLAVSTAFENVNSTLTSVESIAQILGNDPLIRELMEEMNGNKSARYADHLNVASTFWAIPKALPHIAVVGMSTNFPVSLNYQYSVNWTSFYAYPVGGVFWIADASTYNTSLGLNSQHVRVVNPAGWDQNRTLSFLPFQKLWVADSREKINFQYVDDVGRGWWQDAKYGGLLYSLSWPVWRGLPATVAKAGEDPLGMVQVAMSPYRLEAYLKAIKISANAVLSLWEDDGEMVAASVPNATIVPTAALRDVVHYWAHNTTNSLIVSTANMLLSQYKSYDAIPDNLETSFESESGEILVNVRLITSFKNLKWILVLSVPKEDFLGTLESTQRSVIGAVSGTAVGMVLMSTLMAAALVYPIRRLSATMVQATAFDFSAIRDGYLTKQSILEPLEIAHCKAVFNTMLTRFAAAIQANKSLMGKNTTSNSVAASTSQPPTKTR